jgi:hypothetical protein
MPNKYVLEVIMELNGLANIRIIVDGVNAGFETPESAMKKIEHQAILMEKYLIAMRYVPNLMWHEVHMNESLFPNNREVMAYAGQPIDLYVNFLNTRAA